jgi:BirA family biotin operon repressor/biotin-[acetyl-CoA-carboxylase] ligase
MTSPSDLDIAMLTQQLPRGGFVRRLVHVPDTTSTQDIVRAAAVNGEPAGLVVIADHQHAGRGQFGRRWRDIPGQTLLCSFLLRPTPADTPAILMHFAHTLCGVIGKAIPDYSVHLKHPNDVVIDTPTGTKKLAGVIAEGAVQPGGQQWMSVGFGVNIGAAPQGIVDGVDLSAASAAINDWACVPQTRTALLLAVFDCYRPFTTVD